MELSLLICAPVQTIVNTVTESVTQQLPRRLGEYLAYAIDGRLSGPLTEALVADVTEPIALATIASTSKAVLGRVTTGVMRILPRSLAHAVVPALVHTISHSPLQDYYCYYCSVHKVYCAYCHYAPEQLYYAEHYTAYYAEYFAEYYATQYADLWDNSMDISG